MPAHSSASLTSLAMTSPAAAGTTTPGKLSVSRVSRATEAALHRPYWAELSRSLRDRDNYIDLGVHVGVIVVICIAASFVARLSGKLIRRAARPVVNADLRRDQPGHAAYHQTLATVLSSLVRYVVYFVAFILVLGTWNIHALGLMGTALGTAGILGVVVGFGAQKLVRDVMTGTFILLEGQFYVGETITIGSVTGVVEEVGIRVTRVRDEVGRLNLIPNGDIGQMINHSRGGLEAAVEIGVASNQALGPVHEAVDRLSQALANPDNGPVVGPATVQGIIALDGAKATLRVVAAAAPGQQRAAEMALRQAIRDEFLSSGIGLV